MRKLTILLSLLFSPLVLADLVFDRKFCSRVTGTGVNQYNFGCKTAGANCTCASIVGLSTLALWVSACEDPQYAWDGAIKSYCSKVKTSIAKTLDYAEVYENATQYAIPASHIVGNSSPVYPILVDEAYFQAYYNGYFSPWISTQRSQTYAWVPLVYWASVMAIAAIFNISSHMLPRRLMKAFYSGSQSGLINIIRRYISVPAVAGAKHCVPIYLLGYKTAAPTRIQTIIISGYFIHVFILYFVGLDTPADNPLYASKSMQVALLTGRRTGLFVIYQLPVIYMFAFRNNFFKFFTGWSYPTFNLYHRAMSRIMYLELFVHAVTYSVVYVQRKTLTTVWKEKFLIWGLVALVAAIFIMVTGMKYLRDKNYEIFLACHIALVVIFTVGAWYHGGAMGYKTVLYSVFAIWAFERVSRILRVLYFGLGSTCETRIFDDDIMEFIITPSRKFHIMPGEYVFMHILRFNPWESHPFSIMEYDKDSGKIMLLAKRRGGMTKRAANFLAKFENKVTMKVWVDGPYGKRVPVENYDNALIIAGGIGFTAVVPYALQVVEKGFKTHVSVVWVTRSKASLQWAGRHLKRLSDAGVQVVVYCTDQKKFLNSSADSTEIEKIMSRHEVDSVDSACEEVREKEVPQEKIIDAQEKADSLDTAEEMAITRVNDSFRVECGHRPSIHQMISETVQDKTDANGIVDMAVIVCGPEALNDDARASMVKVLKDHKKSRIDYYEEAFNW